MVSSPGGEFEFWFDFGSCYSYLSVMRIEGEAEKYGARVKWRPMLLGPIFRALGFQNAPFVIQKEKFAYVQMDMARECRKYGLPAWNTPSVFPRLGVLPLRIVLVGAEETWVGAFCREVMHRNYALDQDINEPEGMKVILDALHLDSRGILAQAGSEEVKNELRERTERARVLGVFGAPTFFVGSQMFWGNDRLEDALQEASRGSSSRS
jgi:2-hydroxychromene-2-carboxylate isomerase